MEALEREIQSSEAERLMHLFVHDLRAPLSVATGYLRLVQEGRLRSETEQRMALGRTLEALNRMAELCDAAASTGVVSETDNAAGRLPLRDFVNRLSAELDLGARFTGPAGTDLDQGPAGPSVSVGRDGDRFIRGIGLVVRAVTRRQTSVTVTAAFEGDYLRVSVNPRAEASAGPAADFDPWRGFGLEVVIACQAIRAAGGSITTSEPADLVFMFPVVQPRVS